VARAAIRPIIPGTGTSAAGCGAKAPWPLCADGAEKPLDIGLDEADRRCIAGALRKPRYSLRPLPE